MSKIVTIRLPQPIVEFIEKDKLKEDKTVTHVILKLLEEAIELREFKAKPKDPEQERLEALKEECSTKAILRMAGHLGEILRYTFDSDRTKFSGAIDASEVKDRIYENVDKYIEGYLQKSPKWANK